MSTPQPLPASSRRLARSRFQADVARPNDRGSRTVYATGRFTGLGDAVLWADAVHPDAELVNVTYYSERDGWTVHHVAQRVDGCWPEAGQ